ncbi:helix-turn-helix transcriptional regulator [Paludibaculum fermentans]|uniref:Helix-turn-helix transcriptional regulator n=1 Tax=Paludibaculum fermentans TaxID=1473598 RepID=A0A7S7NWH4_PALFE|nr:helix-turn-helix transcriptional regulator [Paludibaculum fermentans]QOY91016.1 helix-turn-helix transcriptional regulator [Paludibaculum fermentans]
MRYEEHRPSPALSAAVDCYWSLEGSGDGSVQPILPDGHCEAVFHLADPPQRLLSGGTAARQPRGLWIGQMESSVLLQPGPRLRVFGIRFRPAGAWMLTGWHQAETTGHILPLDDVWGAQLGELLGNARGTAERIAVADRFLPARLRKPVPAMVEAALRQPRLRVEEIARQAGCSRRQLERLFQAQVGLSPKSWTRIRRMQHSLHLRRLHPGWNWARIAAEAGYFDQAHMNSDYLSLAGAPPARLVESLPGMGEHLARPDR